MMCLHGQEGRRVKPVRIFFGQGGIGVNFLGFYADILYGRPLIDLTTIVLNAYELHFYCIICLQICNAFG